MTERRFQRTVRRATEQRGVPPIQQKDKQQKARDRRGEEKKGNVPRRRK